MSKLLCLALLSATQGIQLQVKSIDSMLMFEGQQKTNSLPNKLAQESPSANLIENGEQLKDMF